MDSSSTPYASLRDRSSPILGYKIHGEFVRFGSQVLISCSRCLEVYWTIVQRPGYTWAWISSSGLKTSTKGVLSFHLRPESIRSPFRHITWLAMRLYFSMNFGVPVLSLRSDLI